MINTVLNAFEKCGYDYNQPMTVDELDEVQRYVFDLSKGEITYGKFKGALYLAGVKIQLKKAKKKKRQGHTKKVDMYDMCGNFIMRFDSIKEAANYVDREPTSISMALTGKSSGCAGYVWKYAEGVHDE